MVMTTYDSIWTEEELLEHIAIYKDAMKKLAFAQEYVIGKRRVTRSDIPDIKNTLAYYRDELRKLKGTGGPILQPGRPAR